MSGDGALRIDGRVSIPEEELALSAARSGGPGGQHVNKASTKVVLRFDLEGSPSLSEAQKDRLRRRVPPRFLTKAGEVVVDAEEHRDQARNREAARAKLAAILRQALKRPKPRRPSKPSKAALRRRRQARERHSRKKAERRERFD